MRDARHAALYNRAMRLSRRDVLGVGAGAVVTASTWWSGCAPRKSATVRAVTQTVAGALTRDGAGVKLRRILGTSALPMLDPFLMLDEFRSRRPEEYQAGFPDHPHRGFETVTIVLDGAVTHRDSVGNHGEIGPGGVQWMTAGRGIVHSEMPRAAAPDAELWGYQLWVNLPARLKMTKPRYQDLHGNLVPRVQLGDAMVRVLAGQANGVRGPVDGVAVQPTVLDVTLEPRARLVTPLPVGQAVCLYVMEGSVVPGGAAGATPLGQGMLAVLGDGTDLELGALTASRLLVLAGEPVREPVARRGPFVMNTDEEIRQAFEDYRSGRLVGG
jgi:redox-sensitive bicupin YhaK (pirin superfamily)